MSGEKGGSRKWTLHVPVRQHLWTPRESHLSCLSWITLTHWEGLAVLS